MHKCLYFVIGGAVGSVATWLCIKRYYETCYKEELASIKKAYSYKKEESSDQKKEVKAPSEPKTEDTFKRERVDSGDIEKYAKLAGVYKNEEGENKKEGRKAISMSDNREDWGTAMYHSLTGIYKNEENENKKKDREVIRMREPYVIMPEEFGDNGEDWGTSTLYYFNDGILCDENEVVLEDPEELIGTINPEEHFGDFEDDVVYVRNEDMETDFEILARDEDRGED